jgi:ribonuclease HI
MTGDELFVFFDGAAKGNPGPAGIGIIFYRKNNEVVREISHFIGIKTNNQAEYEALLATLKEAEDFPTTKLILRTDSELLYRQMLGIYKVRNYKLKKYHQHAIEMLASLPNAKIEFIPREENRAADRLANQAIKKFLKSQTEN